MRFHCLGLPHTVTSHEFVACAYTQKVLKFCKMMKDRGHHIIHYGHEDSDVVCDEHVTVITNEDWTIAYGDYDWRKNFFKFDTGDHAYQTFYTNSIREVGERKQPKDFILPFWGAGTRPVCDAHKDLICVEPGIGYAGGHWANYKVFESYAIYHAFCNLSAVGSCKQNWYDIVIPNYFDPDDFDFRPKKDDYFLFLGRVYDGKGIHAAIQVTKELGAKLVVAGQNNLKDCGYETVPDHVTEVGYADRQKRKELMAGAKGAFVCSLYVEPFGGVQVEMLMSGTPTITTDWGAFTENNIHGVTGYRCHTFEEMCWAARNIDKIDPYDCRAYAMNFTLEKVAVMYEEYFQNIMNIYNGKGWYELNPARQSLDYMSKPLEYDYDFVEIGPGNSGYLRGRGIYVEPMSEMLASIDNPEGIKVNVAITHNKKGDMGNMYYLPGSRDWQCGCTSLYAPHPTLDRDRQCTRPVVVMNIDEFWKKYSIRTVQHLKLCTQGMDCVILEGLYEHLKSRQKWYYPRKVSFQTNELYDSKNISRIFEIFAKLGYEKYDRGTMILSDVYSKVAIFCDTKHAFGRIHSDLHSLVGHSKCDYFDWGNPQEYQKLFKNLKLYSKIITTSEILVNGHKVIDMTNSELLSKLLVVLHCPVFDNSVFMEKIPIEFVGKGITFGGVSRETCANMKTTFGVDAHYLPCGANKNIFVKNFNPTSPVRLGFVNKVSHDPDYNIVKRPDMFKEICDKAGCEAVFIHGIHDPSKLYENIDMVLCTSTYEGNPLGVFECAMSGVPFISTRVGNTIELDTVKHFDTVEDAVEIIKEFKENSDKFIEYRDKICTEVRNTFEWSVLYEKYWKPHLN